MIRAADLWLPGYLRRPRRPAARGALTDVMIAICDHFEPLHGADRQTALDRVAQWQQRYVPMSRRFRDASGVSPRHTFFYPIEQYDPEIVERLSGICDETGSEIEIHLHHGDDTAEGLRGKLERGKEDLARHGGLARSRSGGLAFGFVHGNWALAHSHPEGRHCGVPEELSVLKQCGCYADFTMPSAPDRTQTRIVNQIYYAASNGRPKPHDDGVPARVARPGGGADEILLVQGPLGLNWRRRKAGILPRLENGEISGANPARADRLQLWLDLGIHVRLQPDWIFIKLHTHGGIPRNMEALFGDPMIRFYDYLLGPAAEKQGLRVHFVTAREMANIIHAAEDGHTGDAGRFRNYRYTRNGRAAPGVD